MRCQPRYDEQLVHERLLCHTYSHSPSALLVAASAFPGIMSQSVIRPRLIDLPGFNIDRVEMTCISLMNRTCHQTIGGGCAKIAVPVQIPHQSLLMHLSPTLLDHPPLPVCSTKRDNVPCRSEPCFSTRRRTKRHDNRAWSGRLPACAPSTFRTRLDV